MSQAKTKAKTNKKPDNQTPSAEPVAGEVLTLAEAAAYLRVPESTVIQLMTDQALPGRRLGGEWRFLKAALQDWLRTPPVRGSREAVLSTAGSLKDDPFLLDELEEIYRRRHEEVIGEGE